MFGLKIIRTSDYEALNECILSQSRLIHKQQAEIDAAKQGVKVFQNEEKNVPVTTLPNLVVLREYSYPCQDCTLENKYCKKLIFSDRTMCVTEKEHVNSFFPKKRTKAKNNK